VDYFYSAAQHRFRGVLWSIFALALIHVLFVNYPPEQIAAEINAKYIDPDFEFVVRKKSAKMDEAVPSS